MRVAGTFTYDAPPEVMYEVFTHPDALRNATPGLQSLREAGPDRWEAEIKVGLGGFGLVYAGTVAVTDRRPGEGYRIHMAAETPHGAAGAEVEARLRFEPRDGGGTLLAYEAEVSFLGGQSIQPAIARGLVQFFLHGIKEYVQRERRRSAAR